MTTKAGSFMSYDFADISEPGNEMADEELITTPEQSSTGKREYRWTERDRELNRFPMAMISKLFFFAGCAMFLWMSIDNLYWTNEARTIPQTVLQSTDDTTWRNFRSRQSGMSNGNRKLQYLRAGGSRWLQVIGTTVWQNLAFSKQVAAATLGYNEQTWNERGSVSSDIITWDSLTSGQKEAAQWLGYNQTLWDSTHGFSNRASINNVDPSNTDWGNFLWTELPTEIQTDAAKLGYNQEKWNNGERAYADNLFWDELTSEQQQAATALGYSKATWNVYSSIGSNLTAATAVPSSSGNSYRTSVSGVTSSTTSISVISGSGTQQNSSASKENRTSATDWQLYKWSELPSNIKAAAVVMGFDKELWNKKAGVTTDKYKWEELSSQQQQAASLVFGYTEQSWDAAYNSQWQSYAWDDLPANIQADAKILGYNKTLWNDGAKVATGSYRWDQLTQEQQKAAFNVLGFTAKTWNSDKNGNSNIKNGGGGRDESHGGADDDYVFSVQKAKEKVWISKYQIVYFVAALCFVLVGILGMYFSIVDDLFSSVARPRHYDKYIF